MLGTIVLGGGIGYWIQTKNPDSKAVAYGVIIGILVATPIFFIELHRLSVRLEKEESIKKEKDKENEETEG